MKSKYFYEQHKDTIEREVKELESYEEKNEIKGMGCAHSAVTLSESKLVCRCGAVWTGPSLDRLHKLLKK